MQSSPYPRYLVPPGSKYSSQHHVLRHPQLPFLPQCQRPSFTPIQTTGKIIFLYILIFKFFPFKNNQDMWEISYLSKHLSPCFFSCKIYILWIIFFLQNRDDLFLECLTFGEGTRWLSRNVGDYVSTLRNIPEERKSP